MTSCDARLKLDTERGLPAINGMVPDSSLSSFVSVTSSGVSFLT